MLRLQGFIHPHLHVELSGSRLRADYIGLHLGGSVYPTPTRASGDISPREPTTSSVAEREILKLLFVKPLPKAQLKLFQNLDSHQHRVSPPCLLCVKISSELTLHANASASFMLILVLVVARRGLEAAFWGAGDPRR